MKQTAVEWLLGQLENQVSDDGKQTMSLKVTGFLRDQAKEMEREQQNGYSEEEVKKIIKLSCEQGMLIQRTINDKVKIPYTRIKDFTIKMLEKFKK